MPFYLTRDPVPSADMRNVFDNAQNLDLALNDLTSSLWTDRLGRSRMSWFGLESAFSVKLSDFESRFTSQIVEQEATFDASQADKENRFQHFLVSSGYVFLGDYEDGPFQFSVRNQYIRYNNQYYRLNAATDVGFTTTGTDATSFANDVTHFVLMDGDTLRQNLGSDDGFKLLGQCPSYAALKNVTPGHEGQTIRLSAYYPGWAATALGIPYGRGEYVAVPAGELIDDGGFICVPAAGGPLVWKLAVVNNTLPLEAFGCLADSTRFVDGTDCTAGMNACFSVAIANGFSVAAHSTGPENRGSTKFYYISAPVDATGIHTITGQLSIKVRSAAFDLTGKRWAIMFGDPDTDYRTIQNTLNAAVYVFDADLRAQQMGGIYVKYTRVRGSFRAHYINGSGIRFAPVFDSTVTLWTEVCGNTADFAIDWRGNGDICNQITVLDLVCHDSYHRGVRLVGNKSALVRAHIEGTYTLAISDGTTSWQGQVFTDGIQFMNHVIDLPASEIGQVNIFDSSASVTAEGVPTFNSIVGTHTVVSGRRATHASSIANTGILNKTSFVTPAADAGNPNPSISVGAFQGYAGYILSSSRVDLTNPEIYGRFSTSSSLSRVSGGYIEQCINAGGSSYDGVTFNQPYAALRNGLGAPEFLGCKFNNGIGNLNTGVAKFRHCTINGMTLNATNTPEAAEFTGGRFTGPVTIDVAANSANYKNIVFDSVFFNANVQLPTSNVSTSVLFAGSGNRKSASSVISNWALPASAPNGTIAQFMGVPNTGTGILFVYTPSGWATIASA
ncbi:hypothetical protein AB2709_14420 [Klebsiella quasipneumoniae]|uniref:hypothetical protein n=1 Tax=Klebsiella quasipneumoniae TaxID=1463165 RepID=UPI003464683F